MGKLDITRRDFLNGFALSVAVGSALSPLELMAMEAKQGSPYPPELIGLRGSHVGSFEISHALSWGGASWPTPSTLTDDVYDVVIVGAGLSGLAAAQMYRQRAGCDVKILILDNHDDFGGHAKRNEFHVDGKHLVGYGGSQSIDSPATYSDASSQMLRDAGIDTDPFYEYFDRSYFRDRKLSNGIYFSKEKYGKDSVHKNVLRGADDDLANTLGNYPLSDEAKKSFLNLMTSETDYLPDLSSEQKKSKLKGMSYSQFLREHVGTHEEVVLVLRDVIKGYWGVGYDALSAMEGYRLGMPGAWYMGLEDESNGPAGRDEPYIFHFPDGNAGVARAIVRQLIPKAVPGSTMEDLVLSRVNYGLLDQKGNDMRIRLNSTAVNAQHVPGDQYVDVTYVRDGNPERVRGKHVIMACYNRIVPHICSDMPKSQVEAVNTVAKVPLVYISVALRNWKAFENLGFRSFYIPQPDMMHSFGMDFPVSMGGYQYTQKSDEPTIVHGTYVPSAPDQGLSGLGQHVQGRRDLYEMSYDHLERGIVGAMSGALSGGGFDAERDIAALTVNRWPHGYAYEYNELYDPHDWSPKNGPHIAGAAQMGRISIANSDASAYAFVNGAFDAAHRAVNEQLKVC